MGRELGLTKKTIILYVLNVIKVYASAEHPVSQTAICNYLNEIGVYCDRKTVGRNIEYLKEFGYPIEKVTGRGFYINMRALYQVENRLVI